MMAHTFDNKWQKGLLKLLGYMDGQRWTLLWAMAEFADDKGHCYMTNDNITEACVRYPVRVLETMKEMKKMGLIKVVRKRRMEVEFPGQPYREAECRVLALYAGIEFGLIPAGANVVKGLVAAYHYNGQTVVPQTHKLFRDKFKSKPVKPKYENHGKMSVMDYRRLKPSATYRRKLAIAEADRIHRGLVTRKHNWALKFRYL
jgi:hypothetical protein